MLDGFNSNLEARGKVPSASRQSITGNQDAGDFFAPFFDVVFYTLDEEAQAEVDFEQSILDATGLSNQGLTTFDSVQGLTLEEVAKRRTVGNTKIKISSVNGETQVFSPNAALAGIRNFKANLTIEARASTAYKATLLLQPPFFDARELIDEEVMRLGGLMELQWGYLSRSGKPLLYDKGIFYIQEPSVRYGKQVSIVIAGWDIISTSGSSLDRRRIWKKEEFETDADILSEIARIHNTRLRIKTKRSTSPLHDKNEEDRIQATDDYTFFHRLCVSNDVAYRVKKTVIFLDDLTRLDQLKPKYRLLFYTQPESGTDIPMISFDSNSILSLFSAGEGARGIFSTSYDLDEDEVSGDENLPEEQKDQPGDTRRTGNQDAALKARGYGHKDAESTGKYVLKPHERPKQREERKIKARNALRQANTTATAVIPGHPTILPLDMVNVYGKKGVGVGDKFGGIYRVMKVTHDVGTAGYITKLELLRAETTGSHTSTDPKTDDQPTKSRKVEASSGELVDPVDSDGDPVVGPAPSSVEPLM